MSWVAVCVCVVRRGSELVCSVWGKRKGCEGDEGFADWDGEQYSELSLCVGGWVRWQSELVRCVWGERKEWAGGGGSPLKQAASQ